MKNKDLNLLEDVGNIRPFEALRDTIEKPKEDKNNGDKVFIYINREPMINE